MAFTPAAPQRCIGGGCLLQVTMQDVYLDAIKMVQQLSVHLRLNGLNHVSTPNRACLCVCVIVCVLVCLFVSVPGLPSRRCTKLCW